MPKLHVLQDVFPYIQGGDDEVGGYSPAELRPWPEPERAPPRPQQLPWPCTDTTTASDREEADVTRVPKSRMRNVWRRSRSSGAMTSWKRISTSARATLQRGGVARLTSDVVTTEGSAGYSYSPTAQLDTPRIDCDVGGGVYIAARAQ